MGRNNFSLNLNGHFSCFSRDLFSVTECCRPVLLTECELMVSTHYSYWQWRALLERNDFFSAGNQKMLYMDDYVFSEVG